MKQVRKLMRMCMLMLMLLTLSACQKEEEATEDKPSTVATVTEDVTATETQESQEPEDVGSTEAPTESTTNAEKPAEGTFDFEYLRQHVVIDGKEVSMPFCLDDLGEGYEFEEIGRSEGLLEHRCGTGLDLPNGKEIVVMVEEDVIQDIARESKIMSVTVNESTAECFSVDGMKVGINIEDIQKKLGAPSNIDGAVTTIQHWYYEAESGQIRFAVKEGKISSMNIYIY